MAWPCIISPEVTVKGFEKCCISNAVDETGDDCCEWQWIGGNVWSECQDNEGTDCAEEDSDADW